MISIGIYIQIHLEHLVHTTQSKMMAKDSYWQDEINIYLRHKLWHMIGAN